MARTRQRTAKCGPAPEEVASATGSAKPGPAWLQAAVQRQTTPPGFTLALKARPGSKRDDLYLADHGTVVLTVTAPPSDGEANRAIVALLAKKLALPKAQLELVKGQSARQKVIRIATAEPDAVLARLRLLLGDGPEATEPDPSEPGSIDK